MKTSISTASHKIVIGNSQIALRSLSKFSLSPSLVAMYILLQQVQGYDDILIHAAKLI
jgi:hypothetical protein